MRAIGIAVAELSDNPYPSEAFQWGEILRLRVGSYRIMYTVESDLIAILRVDRVRPAAPGPHPPQPGPRTSSCRPSGRRHAQGGKARELRL
jgi:hypothetical protein